MEFKDYQQQALKTDQATEENYPANKIAHQVIPLMGLAGEAGELLSEYKKHLRDGKAHSFHEERIGEELGDILWYVANVASKYGLDLENIAEKNLKKIQDRWDEGTSYPNQLDAKFPEGEKFPRRFEAEIIEDIKESKRPVELHIQGKQRGSPLTDNTRDNDGYRFHDVFHLAYVAVLGWSPNIRKFMGCKRRSDSVYDEVEDGGRARVIDEAIAALAFTYAQQHNWLEGIERVDCDLLKTIKNITSHLEVKNKTTREWEKAIIDGFKVWRSVRDNKGGRISVDMDAKEIKFLGPCNSTAGNDTGY